MPITRRPSKESSGTPLPLTQLRYTNPSRSMRPNHCWLRRSCGRFLGFLLSLIDAAPTLFLDRSGQAGDVVLDEERVDEGHRQRAEQRTRHQWAPVVDVALDQLG